MGDATAVAPCRQSVTLVLHCVVSFLFLPFSDYFPAAGDRFGLLEAGPVPVLLVAVPALLGQCTAAGTTVPVTLRTGSQGLLQRCHLQQTVAVVSGLPDAATAGEPRTMHAGEDLERAVGWGL